MSYYPLNYTILPISILQPQNLSPICLENPENLSGYSQFIKLFSAIYQAINQ